GRQSKPQVRCPRMPRLNAGAKISGCGRMLSAYASWNDDRVDDKESSSSKWSGDCLTDSGRAPAFDAIQVDRRHHEEPLPDTEILDDEAAEAGVVDRDHPAEHVGIAAVIDAVAVQVHQRRAVDILGGRIPRKGR